MSLRDQISAQMDAGAPNQVWVPRDFALLGHRDAVDKVLQRMVQAGELRRVDRGLYGRPVMSRLMRRVVTPGYIDVIEAVARRDSLRLMPDGITSANQIGLTDAVPAKVVLHSDTRRRSIRMDQLVITFKFTSARRMYWAGRPAMRVVQALYWLKDMLPRDGDDIRRRLSRVLTDAKHGAAIRADLIEGFGYLPSWMRTFLRSLPVLFPSNDEMPTARR